MKTCLISFALLLLAVPAHGETFKATVTWAQSLELGPLVGGTVASTSAEIGDRVRKGDELMRIDPTPYEHKVIVGEARARAAESRYESAKQEYERQWNFMTSAPCPASRCRSHRSH